MTANSFHPYVVTIDLQWETKLLQDLQKQKFEITVPPYTRFSAKKKGLTCTLYQSGKLVIQGKKCAEFIEFYLEPEILQTFHFRHPLTNMDLAPHIGIDESGKGDFLVLSVLQGSMSKKNNSKFSEHWVLRILKT